MSTDRPTRVDRRADVEALRGELERLTASFEQVAGEDGRIQVPEFQGALELKSEFVARHLFRLFDPNGDGVIDRDEFLGAIEGLLTGTADAKLQFLFRVHDQDADGSIERVELDRLLHLGLAESRLELPEALVDEMVDAMFEASDQNGDGRIEFDEFADVFAGYPALLDRITRANSVWRALRDQPATNHSQVSISSARRVGHWLEENGRELVFLLVYAVINLALFAEAMHRYAAAGAPPLVQLARGCGACLNFNGALILVPMLRYFLSWIRARRLGKFIPVDHSVAFHKVVGHVIFGLAVVHTLAHLGNYGADGGSVVEPLFTTKGGVTGLVVMLALTAMWGMSLEPVRRDGRFELFHRVHLLYWVFFAVLLVHGPVYWMWVTLPLAGYLVERALRARQRSATVELETKVLPSRVTRLRFAAPPGWRHRAGDYLFILIPDIARAEWHPFTISSAPEHIGPDGGPMTLHVRSLGNWTRRLAALAAERADSDAPAPLVGRLDGPYGTPSGHIFHSKYAVLIGAGIGVTPFAAILDSILQRTRRGDGTSTLERVHFIWVNRDQHAFEWFTELLAELEARDQTGLLDIHIYMTGGRDHIDAAAVQLAREVFYAKTQRDIVTGLAARTHFGRPDWETVLTEVLREHTPERVDVFMCGPMPLVRVLEPLCRDLGMGFRHEVF